MTTNDASTKSTQAPSVKDEAVTTTKALLVQIVCPRTFSTVSEIKTPNPKPEQFQKQSVKPQSLKEREVSEYSEALQDFSQEITAEEQAAVQVDREQNQGAVNMEELLKIAFQKLATEWHLLNVPTYTMVKRLTRIKTETSSENCNDSLHYRIDFDDEPEDDNFEEEWIQLNVMVRPSSLEIVLERLDRIGVGENVGTVNVIQCDLCKTASPLAAHRPDETTEPKTASQPPSRKPSSMSDDDDQAEALNKRAIEAARAEWKNAATRLRIEQVREQIDEQAALSLDFIALLSIASILAGIGLITDNTVVIVASMLVSPIMGPVLGLTFGTRIRDWPLVRSSLLHESLALLGCVLIGALIGIGASFTDFAQDNWPTAEMENRGETAGLLTGIAIAIPSGMGVCLSILGGNTSSLVGVAISASLLPPAVNTGVCLVYAIFLAAGAVDGNDQGKAEDFFRIGGISFALTVLNILCIWVAGLFMFQVKEVAPTEKKNAFWAKDLKVARELNKKEKPRPVNFGILRRGVKSAIKDKEKKEVDKVQIKPPPRHRKTPSTGLGGVGVNLGNALAIRGHRRNKTNESVWGAVAEEEDVDENVRYVGLEDMAKLLGFDQEDDELIDHAAVGRRVGKGHYL